jgi:uncharacterized protein (DUF3820 family)
MSFVFKFGKHAGCYIEDVPLDYLEWMRDKNAEMNGLIDAELRRRELLAQDQMPMVEKLIHEGYRALARKLHPDAGGSEEAFKALQAAYEQLRTAVKEVK